MKRPNGTAVLNPLPQKIKKQKKIGQRDRNLSCLFCRGEMNKINYQKELEKTLENITKSDIKPSLLLHVCCAPCSSYVLEYLNKYFNITALFYNPNISTKKEYDYRASELERLIKEMPLVNEVDLEIMEYDDGEFYDIAKGYEECKEGGERCFRCYELRLRKAAKYASEKNFDFFTTTLSISPLKNSEKLNSIGEKLSIEYKIPYLFSDFKKKEGYKRSIELSKEYDLYRQNYCGCVYSQRDE